MIQEFTDREAQQYFQRIGLAIPSSADAKVLNTITRSHIQSIPFENFDLMLGLGTDLNPDVVFQKMVLNKRGGCCFELNGLLQRALVYLGFDVKPLLARVQWRGDPGPRTHLLLQITIDKERWLVDVGFGGPGLVEPIPFRCDENFQQGSLQFRVCDNPDYQFMLQTIFEGQWKNVYSFDLTAVNPSDVEMANFFVTHYANSFFTLSRIATIPTAKGRNTLVNYTLTQKNSDGDHIIELKDDDTYLKALSSNFGIQLDVDYDSLKKISI